MQQLRLHEALLAGHWAVGTNSILQTSKSVCREVATWLPRLATRAFGTEQAGLPAIRGGAIYRELVMTYDNVDNPTRASVRELLSASALP